MTSTVLNVIILIVNVILWLFFFVKYKKTFSPENILHSISEEVDKLLIEIDKTADRDLTLLEDKKNSLKALIDEADKRIQLAISEEHKVELSKKGTRKINAATKTAAVAYQRSKPRPAENTNAEELTYIPEDHSKAKTADVMETRTVQTMTAAEMAQSELPFEVTVSEDFVKTEKTLPQKVIELWRQNLDAEYIAEKLGVTHEAVHMIIDMYGV